MNKAPQLYKKYYIDKSDERLELFRIISERYDIKSGLYPGSFIHITPSFVIPKMVYIDTKSGKKLNREEIKRTMKGSVYTKIAYAYVFRKQVKHGTV